MRIERDAQGWVVLDGCPPHVGRWRMIAGTVVLQSPSKRVYCAAPEQTPLDVAVALLALRDAEAFVRSRADDEAAAFALRTWLSTSRDRLIEHRGRRRELCCSAWALYRYAFLRAVDGRG